MHATYCVILVNLSHQIKAFDPADVEGYEAPRETPEQVPTGPEGLLKSVPSLRDSQMS